MVDLEEYVKISLIIPTRERASLLQHCLKTALAIQDDEIEIIVCDNCSQDATPEVIGQVSDPRVVKVRANKRLSMRENFENGLRHATGDYICFIGDDDGFVPNQFPFARRLLEQTSPDTMAYSFLRYAWPGAGSKSKEGTVRLERRRLFRQARKIDLEEMRDNALSGRVNWLEGWPDIYHGFVSRAYIERIRVSPGDFFRGRAPDVFFTYLSLLRGSNHLFVPHCFSISGYSSSSTGGSTHQVASSSSTDSPAHRFEQEASVDPIQDRINLGFGVPPGLFSTIVQACREAGGRQPDYAAWFSYIIRSTQEMEDLQRRTVLERLQGFIAEENLWAEWQQANSTGASIARSLFRVSPDNLRMVVTKALNKAHSFRVSAHRLNDLTIAGACSAVDQALSDSFVKVLSGEMTASEAWNGACRRGATR
ncbi:glycosyltransferase family 2 protein [Tabrizicola sp. M-4]|uniref:glycosyltransferase family 2 protein n=1 Tax=Tabrizicola sp. M-4 TaxID=3055847 RepID=UPI003DA8CA0C